MRTVTYTTTVNHRRPPAHQTVRPRVHGSRPPRRVVQRLDRDIDQAELPQNSRRPDKEVSFQKKPLSPIVEERKTMRKFNRHKRHRSHDRKPSHSKDHAYSKERTHRPSKQNRSKKTVRVERREHGWSSSSEYDSEGEARRSTKKSSSQIGRASCRERV